MKILLSGEGGQGIQTMAKILVGAAYNQHYKVNYMPHYGVEMRMGISRAFVTISSDKITYPKFSKADILSVMTKRNLNLVKEFIDKNTKVINAIDLVDLPEERNLPTTSFNMIVLGIIVKEINKSNIKIDKEKILEEINKFLGKKPDLTKNRVAFEVGYDLADNMYSKLLKSVKPDKFEPIINKDDKKEHIIYPDICKGCGICLIKCPVGALSWDKNKKNFLGKPIPKVDMEKCIGCGICEDICPDAAIKVNKKSKTN